MLQLDAGHITVPSCSPPLGMEEIITPLCWQAGERCLEKQPDTHFWAYIVNGISFGFRVDCTYQHTCSRFSHNMPSALERPEVIREYLAKECSEGRVLGPLDPTKFPHIHTSCFGVIPKGLTGRWLICPPHKEKMSMTRGPLPYMGAKDGRNTGYPGTRKGSNDGKSLCGKHLPEHTSQSRR